MLEKMDLKARHNARKHLVQAIYQWQLTAQNSNDIQRQFLDDFLGTRVDLPYFKAILQDLPQHSATLDALFLPFSERVEKDIDPIELAILRLATYELLLRLDVPYPVVINEALELTKKFGAEESFRFVNSILDHVAKNTRTAEYAR